MSGIDPSLLLASLMVAATPILLAALGELIVERAGVINLGVEGMMITGAICGFIAAHHSGSAVLGFAGAALGGAVLSLLFAALVLGLMTNQVATGLALTLFGLGLSARLGQDYIGIKGPVLPKLELGALSDLPLIGPAVFGQDGVVYLGLLATVLTWLFLSRTRAGLILRAVGENAEAAHALGYKVRAIRLAAIAYGGAMAGLGGAYISLVRVPQWTEGMTAGAGWIALAMVVFASWQAGRALIGAWLFGGVSVLQLNLQAAGSQISPAVALITLGVIAGGFTVLARPDARRSWIRGAIFLAAAGALALVARGLWPGAAFAPPVSLLSMLPYLATIIALVMMQSGRAPASLGRPFHAST